MDITQLKAKRRVKKPKVVSMTYDTDNSQFVVICDDGSMWKREFVRKVGVDGWAWNKFEDFNPP